MQRELVERAQRGDPHAFAEIVRLSAGRLYAIAYRVLRDADGAEDAAQHALIEVWDGLPSLHDPDRFDAWAYRLVVRAAYREAGRENRWRTRVHLIPSSGQGDSDPADGIASRDELEQAFKRLTPEHRAVLVLRYYADLPLAEVAEVVGAPVGTVSSRLHHAMRGLRAALQAEARGAVAEGQAV